MRTLARRNPTPAVWLRCGHPNHLDGTPLIGTGHRTALRHVHKPTHDVLADALPDRTRKRAHLCQFEIRMAEARACQISTLVPDVQFAEGTFARSGLVHRRGTSIQGHLHDLPEGTAHRWAWKPYFDPIVDYLPSDLNATPLAVGPSLDLIVRSTPRAKSIAGRATLTGLYGL
jgi:hypothetical protein